MNSFFFWPLYLLSVFVLRLLITLWYYLQTVFLPTSWSFYPLICCFTHACKLHFDQGIFAELYMFWPHILWNNFMMTNTDNMVPGTDCIYCKHVDCTKTITARFQMVYNYMSFNIKCHSCVSAILMMKTMI